MWKRFFLGLCVAGMATVFVSTARAEVTFNERLPFSFSFFDSCTGEIVDVSGTFHNVVSIVETKNGIRQTNNLNAKGKGVGRTSGTDYEWNDGIRTKIVNPIGVPFEQRQVQLLRLISHGKAKNLVRTVEFLFFVDEDGNSTVEDFNVTDCRGA